MGGCCGGAGSQEAGAGSLLQEAGCGRRGVVLQVLDWEEECPRRSKGGRSGVPPAAYYSARVEGTGGAGTLGEESLQHLYMPLSRDWCAPININIGKFHCRVTCQCGPTAVAKLQLSSCLDRLG